MYCVGQFNVTNVKFLPISISSACDLETLSCTKLPTKETITSVEVEAAYTAIHYEFTITTGLPADHVPEGQKHSTSVCHQ